MRKTKDREWLPVHNILADLRHRNHRDIFQSVRPTSTQRADFNVGGQKLTCSFMRTCGSIEENWSFYVKRKGMSLVWANLNLGLRVNVNSMAPLKGRDGWQDRPWWHVTSSRAQTRNHPPSSASTASTPVSTTKYDETFALIDSFIHTGNKPNSLEAAQYLQRAWVYQLARLRCQTIPRWAQSLEFAPFFFLVLRSALCSGSHSFASLFSFQLTFKGTASSTHAR